MTSPTPPVYDDEADVPGGVSRRAVITGACLLCVGVGGAAVFAACGSGSGSGSGGSGGSGNGAAAGPFTYQASQIPVGGGTVFDKDKVVVTQPTAGEFKAFSAICTHQGFLVGNVQGGTINCFHHGSMYNDATGQVVGGPAPSPLPGKAVSVSGSTITVT